MKINAYLNPYGGKYVPPAGAPPAKSREGRPFGKACDQVEISPQGQAAQGRVQLEKAVESGDLGEIRKAAEKLAGSLGTNENAAADPGGKRYAAAYIKALVGQYEKARSAIAGYYADAHRENLTFENPHNHILEKYVISSSPYFQKDMSQAQREMALRQEEALLFGGSLTLNDPYALGGRAFSFEEADRLARQAAREELDALAQAWRAKEDEEPEEPAKTEESKSGGKVAFNEGKRARQLAAASSQDQVQQVLALLEKDLSDCEAGLAQGMCDEAEVAKVRAMIQRAHQRMSQVPKESESTGLDAFAMASLL